MWPVDRAAAVAQAVYTAFTIQAFIPFDPSTANDRVPFTDDVRTAVQVRSGDTSKTFHPIIDTGSCGFVVSAADLPGWNKTDASRHPSGWEFLSSSKILYSGHWIPRDLYFTNAGVEVHARIPVLAVETRTHCPNYNRTRDTSRCATPTDGSKTTVTNMPKGIRVLGVGFGREKDGQPQGTPDKNAFLNVRTIDRVNVKGNARFRNGYSITKDGITIGLTKANTVNMKFFKLSLRNKGSGPHDWAAIGCCMSVDGAACTRGTALVDTGVAQMYMTLPLGTKVHRKEPPVLNNGSVVDVTLGAPSKIVASEKFTVGDAAGIRNGVVPSSVRLTLADPRRNEPHVNTGRHFLRAWRMSFDSDGGFLGFGKA